MADIKPVKTMVYTGAELKPAVVVTGLNEKKNDFAVSYQDNVNAGTGTAEITLNSNYIFDSNANKTVATFTINPATISSIKVGTAYYKGEGTEAKPSSVEVYAGKIKLTSAEYNIAYSDNKTLTTKAEVTVTPMSANFGGEKTVYYKIVKESIAKMDIVGVADKVYNGKEQKFTSLKVNGVEVVGNDKYLITYTKNTNAGKATVSVKANPDCIYTGTAIKTFNITPVAIDGFLKMSGTLPELTYNGKAQTFNAREFTNKFTEKGTGNVIPVKSLKFAYSNNINAGKGKLVITASGNYKGTTSIDFVIKPMDISKFYVKMQKTVKVPSGWTKGKAVLSNVEYVKESFFSLNKLSTKDYTITYSNNTNKGVARLAVNGAGNYTGSKICYYTIK